jgi:N2227-like protein
LHIDTAEYQMRATQYKEAAIRNQFCLDCILRHAGMPHSQQPLTNGGSDGSVPPPDTAIVSDSQLSKTSSVLKSLARDWSADGKPERDMAYGPLMEQLKRYLPLPRGEEAGKRPPPRVCVPGAGEFIICNCILSILIM